MAARTILLVAGTALFLVGCATGGVSSQFVVPKANAPKRGAKDIEGLTIHAVERIEEAMDVVRQLQ